jgi:hypothetical protein
MPIELYKDPIKIAEVVIAAVTFLVVISYIFKDNAAYKLFSHIMLGAGTGFGVYLIWAQVLKPNWWEPMAKAITALFVQGQPTWALLWILCLVPGLMWYTLYSKKLSWMSRIVFGLFIGLGAGLAFKTYFLLIMPQVKDSFRSLLVFDDGAFHIQETIKNLLFTGTFVTVLIYFIFTLRMETPFVQRGRIFGRWMIMICFGTLFGYTVMTRMSYFLERLDYVRVELFQKVLGL